jgi:cation transporter-like permease
VEPGDAETRRDVRTVEIGSAVLVGVLIVIVPGVALWLVGHLAGFDGASWAATKQIVLVGTIVVGLAVAVWRLVKAGRRGI